MNSRHLTVRVKNHIRQYIMESLGTDIIRLERDRTLLAVIKPYLILDADDWELEPMPEGFGELYIELPHLNQEWEAINNTVYWCDTLFRDHLDRRGLEKVRNFFNRTFKASFRTFMDGYTESQLDTNSLDDQERRIKVKRGAAAFLMQYHITPDEKLIRALVRDWYRHTERNESNRFSPLLY